MSNRDSIEVLKETSVTKLNFGNASIRRAIKRAGFDTLPEILDLPEREIDDIFDWEAADTIVGLQEKYHANPDALAVSVLQKKEVDRSAVEKRLSETRVSHTKANKTKSVSLSRSYYSIDGPIALPPAPFSDVLKSFEKRAKESFDELDDRFENVMVYQAFDEFSTDLDELSDAFAQIFNYYQNQPRAILNLIDKQLRNAFVVYVADKARNVYCEGNLWGNFFGELGIHDSNAQSLFKQTFTNHIERRGMPLYARDEETNYYFYTALLHGGLSADSWSNLWDKCILPLAKEIEEGSYGFGADMDGHSIIKELKNPKSRFSPKKVVLNILEKAPDSTIAPLFEASMRVALQVENAKKAKGGYAMLSNFGLPESAMEALRNTQEQSAPSRAKACSTNSTRESNNRNEQRLVYLPMANLQLDLAEGVVSMNWPRQQFPLHFAECRIDYYVDGNKKQSSGFDMSVGKCILEASSITAKPQTRYNIELKLMRKDERTGEYMEASSLHQAFTRNKPGCFEFIKDVKGIYRLRGCNEKITRKRRIAYIVKNGYKIEPGQGMTAISEYEASGDWDATQIFIYDVEPGSAGSIVNTQTNEEIAVWQERYTAKIDKRRVIGETCNGIDLYGYVPCGLDTNGGLPSVTIEAIDGQSALEDLDIICVCDEQRISMPRRIMWTDGYDESSAAQIALVPQESSLFDWHIEECSIEARQKSAGDKVVFRYKFAVIPIQNFRPSSISFDHGIAVAKYGFQATLAIDVTNTQGKVEAVNAWGEYNAKTLLKDEFLHLRIQSKNSGKVTEAKLALAAIEITPPQRLVNISKTRPVCFADILDLGPSATNFKVAANGRRHNRIVMAGLFGSEPIFFKKLEQPGKHDFNLFRYASDIQQKSQFPPKKRPLTLTLFYGDDVTQGYLRQAWRDVEVIDYIEGVGISSWEILATEEGEHVLLFDGRPVCDVCFEFKKKPEGKIFATALAKRGSERLVLPSNVARLLDMQKEITVEMSPSDWFGNPQREYATESILKRQA